jgi:hypothetical protein
MSKALYRAINLTEGVLQLCDYPQGLTAAQTHTISHRLNR